MHLGPSGTYGINERETDLWFVNILEALVFVLLQIVNLNRKKGTDRNGFLCVFQFFSFLISSFLMYKVCVTEMTVY